MNTKNHIGIWVLVGALSAVTSLHAQVTISTDGVVESTSGGFKFPDGSVQTTAASNAAPIYVVKDSTGQQVGGPAVFISNELARIPVSVPLDVGGTLDYFADVNAQGFQSPGGGILVFKTNDCTGQAYISNQSNPGGIAPVPAFLMLSNPVAGTSEIWVPTDDTPELFTPVSYLHFDDFGSNSIVCDPIGGQFNGLPAAADVDLHQLYVPPFSLELVN